MDIGLDELRAMVTVAAFLTFLGVVAWAYGTRRKDAYALAARMAVDDEFPIGTKEQAE